MVYQHLIFERQDKLVVITLNRPERANAMHRPLLNEMTAACAAIEADDGIHAVVLTGAGNAFSSGFDLKEQTENPPQGVTGWRPVLRKDFDAVMQFWYLSKPVIAAVKGLALASGFELACACDITIAGEDAIFGEPELKFGAGIVVMLLPWLTGPDWQRSSISPARTESRLGGPSRWGWSIASFHRARNWRLRWRWRATSP